MLLEFSSTRLPGLLLAADPPPVSSLLAAASMYGRQGPAAPSQEPGTVLALPGAPSHLVSDRENK